MNRLSEPTGTDDLGARIRAVRGEAEHLRFLAGPLGSGSSQPKAEADLPAGMLPGDFIPGYAFIRELYRGGQGIVYEAMHLVTGRRVAIKLRRAAGSGAEIRRFEREAALLTQLRHPNIVTVYDAGVVAESCFIVMDFVDGRPIDRFVAEEKPTSQDLLRLFAAVCDAVHAAHLRGVIHRDLKPANILVRKGVSAAEPIVLDFGLAKQVGDEVASEVTVAGQFVGSLPWASPEQAAGDATKIDIRTDVYSLGVILYQLLTGRFPHDVTGATRDVLDRIIRIQPARPRLVVGCYAIDDEVETIVVKCLAKERARRYQSAGELAADIRRYLAGEAIDARRDSGRYMLRKMLKRHRAVATVATAFVLLLGIATAVSISFWQHAIGERDRAIAAEQEQERERKRAVMLGGWLRRALDAPLASARNGPPKEDGDTPGSPCDFISRSVAELELSLAGYPEQQFELRTLFGGVFTAHGCWTLADRQYELAIEAARNSFGPKHPLVAKALETHANFLLYQVRRMPAAEPLPSRPELRWAAALCQEALTIYRESPGSDPLDKSSILNILAICERLRDDHTSAEHHQAEAFRIADAVSPTHGARYRKWLAERVTEELQLYDLAEPLQSEALATIRLSHNEEWIADHLHSYAVLLRYMNRLAEAEAAQREALDIRQQTYPQGHPARFYVYATMESLGETLRMQGRFAEAEPLLRDAFENYRPPPDPDLFAIRVEIVQRIDQLYKDWEAAEPEVGAEKAAAWRQKLDVYPKNP